VSILPKFLISLLIQVCKPSSIPYVAYLELHLLWKISSTIAGLNSREERLAKEAAAAKAQEAKAAREAASATKKATKKK